MNAPIVDLRSDTVTRPTPAMRRAMAEAEVGDDVFGDDPTVIALERRVAALAGKEAALYVPSGTMGNQLAVHVQTRPGDEVLLEAESHIYFYEQGGIAANSGCLAHPVRAERGVLPIDTLLAAIRDAADDHVARVTPTARAASARSPTSTSTTTWSNARSPRSRKCWGRGWAQDGSAWAGCAHATCTAVLTPGSSSPDS